MIVIEVLLYSVTIPSGRMGDVVVDVGLNKH